MTGYVAKVLQRFNHAKPAIPQHAPHPHVPPNYGSRIQAPQEDTSEPLPAAGILRLQQAIGCLLYYGRAVDNTMLKALGSLGAAQSTGTTKTANTLTQLLNYCATHPEATIRFRASKMILHIHSDGSYLSETKARSYVAGYFYLSALTKPPPDNGPVHVITIILRTIVANAAEVEISGTFHNGQEGVALRNTLAEMG